jgi:predicted metal-dependent peptidase
MELKRNNEITMDSILDGLPDLVIVKVRQCSSAKEIWDKLHNTYSKEYILKTTDLEHVDRDIEDIEIKQEEFENDEEYYEEGEVDLEAKLINALSEIKGEEKKQVPQGIINQAKGGFSKP